MKPSTKNLGTPHTHIRVFFPLFLHTNTKTLRNALILRSNVCKGKNIRPYVLKRKFEPKNGQKYTFCKYCYNMPCKLCVYIRVCICVCMCVLLRLFCLFCCNEYKNMARFARFLAYFVEK